MPFGSRQAARAGCPHAGRSWSQRLWWSPGGRPRCEWSRAGGVGLGSVALAVLLAGAASAGSYPETARSIALSTPPELVDEASLLFQLPSRAGLAPTQLFAFTASPYYYYFDSYNSTTSLGIVGQTRGQAFFVLAQPSFLITDKPAFQAGWGGAWRTLRLGAAARASRSESESWQSRQTASSTSWSVDRQQQEHWEASFGVGLGGERFALDMAVDVQHFEESSDQSRLGYDTLTVHVESDNDLSAGISGRFMARFGAVELTGAGGWSRIDGGIGGATVAGGAIDSVAASRMFENWFGGLAVHFPTERLDRVTIAAHWSHREMLPEYSSFTKSIQARRLLAISVQDEPWSSLQVQAGISLRYEDQAREQGYDSYYEDVWYENKWTELQADFSWGVSYSWKMFEGRAALRETLPLQDLFAAVDFFVRL